MKVKEESEKAGLKLNIKKKEDDSGFQTYHFMANTLISWRGGSLMGFLELRQARGVYSRVTMGMPILNGSLFSEVRTLV